MKRSIAFLTVFVLSTGLWAQGYTHSLDGIKWVKIESKSDIVVKTHSKSQLLIKGKTTDPIPEKAKGLRLVGDDGTDNTEVGFYVFKDGNDLIIRNLRKMDGGSSEIYLPSNQNISVNSKGLNDIEITGFSGEIEASAEVTGNITILEATGPITANSNTGNISVTFNKVNQAAPISISTATGEVDITLPTDTPADLSLQSTMGEIYTNFDLSVPDKNGLKAVSTQKINGAINKGGVKINLNSATGNIYLRKKQ
ncbi:MAG: DUF4097 family beta strand repeat-containing protein [Sediminicola sp.]